MFDGLNFTLSLLPCIALHWLVFVGSVTCIAVHSFACLVLSDGVSYCLKHTTQVTQDFEIKLLEYPIRPRPCPRHKNRQVPISRKPRVVS